MGRSLRLSWQWGDWVGLDTEALLVTDKYLKFTSDTTSLFCVRDWAVQARGQASQCDGL